MARITWRDLDERRAALPRKLSRAEMCRLAGVSESTATKGLQDGGRTAVSKSARQKIELVLEAKRIEGEQTQRQMGELGQALARRLE